MMPVIHVAALSLFLSLAPLAGAASGSRPALAAPASLSGPPGGGTADAANKYVQQSITLEKRTVRAGSTGALLVRLRPHKGIHVNTQPPILFSLDEPAGGSIAVAGTPVVPTTRVDTSLFLDSSKPIRQPFRVARSLKPGQITLRGTLTYFYCSDAEGWCSKFRQPIELTLTVVR